MARSRAPHEPTDECSYLHCYSHMVDEGGTRVSDGYYVRPYYLVCGECNHVFRTAWTLRLANWRAYARLGCHEFRRPYWRAWWRTVMLRPDRIYSCPYCSHDF